MYHNIIRRYTLGLIPAYDAFFFDMAFIFEAELRALIHLDHIKKYKSQHVSVASIGYHVSERVGGVN